MSKKTSIEKLRTKKTEEGLVVPTVDSMIDLSDNILGLSLLHNKRLIEKSMNEDVDQEIAQKAIVNTVQISRLLHQRKQDEESDDTLEDDLYV